MLFISRALSVASLSVAFVSVHESKASIIAFLLLWLRIFLG